MDCKLGSVDGGNSTGNGVRGGLIIGATVSDEEPSCGFGERASDLMPIGLDGEEMGQEGYEETGAWMEGFVDIS